MPGEPDGAAGPPVPYSSDKAKKGSPMSQFWNDLPPARFWQLLAWISFAIMMVIAIPLDRAFHHANWVRYAFIAQGFATMFFALNHVLLRDARRANRVREIVLSEEVRNVGRAIDLYVTMPYFSASRKSLREMLIRLLSNLRPTDALLLTDSQHRRLSFMLQGGDRDMVIAILKAIEQIGDSRMLSYVRKLAAGQWSAGNSQEVQEAARRCLTHFEAHF